MPFMRVHGTRTKETFPIPSFPPQYILNKNFMYDALFILNHEISAFVNPPVCFNCALLLPNPFKRPSIHTLWMFEKSGIKEEIDEFTDLQLANHL